jgi:hypothetical protein
MIGCCCALHVCIPLTSLEKFPVGFCLCLIDSTFWTMYLADKIQRPVICLCCLFCTVTCQEVSWCNLYVVRDWQWCRRSWTVNTCSVLFSLLKRSSPVEYWNNQSYIRNSGKHNHIFSLNQRIHNSSQLHFSTLYGLQAGQKKKISTHLYLGLRYKCITYVFYMYRHQVRWHSWGRELLWTGWSGVWPQWVQEFIISILI